MPGLKHLQQTRDHEHPDRNPVHQFLPWQKEKHDQDPKNFIKQTSSVVVEPPLGRPRVELEQEPHRSDSKKGKKDMFADSPDGHDQVDRQGLQDPFVLSDIGITSCVISAFC